MLKYEGIAKVGDRIKAFDFEPMPGRDDRFIEGTVIDDNRTSEGSGARGYVIVVDKDSVKWDGGYSRVGLEVFVPFQMAIMEYDGRITKL